MVNFEFCRLKEMIAIEQSKKSKNGIRFLLLYLSASVILIVALSFALDPPKPKVKIHYMDKADMFEIVKNNSQVILKDIQTNDFSQTLDLLKSSRGKPEVYVEGDIVTFYCYGFGFASATSYEGFYYTPLNIPARIGGIEAPYVRYHSSEELPDFLKQENNEWVWYEKDENSGGDNEYHTEKICDYFWYYYLKY